MWRNDWVDLLNHPFLWDVSSFLIARHECVEWARFGALSAQHLLALLGITVSHSSLQPNLIFSCLFSAFILYWYQTFLIIRWDPRNWPLPFYWLFFSCQLLMTIAQKVRVLRNYDGFVWKRQYNFTVSLLEMVRFIQYVYASHSLNLICILNVRWGLGRLFWLDLICQTSFQFGLCRRRNSHLTFKINACVLATRIDDSLNTTWGGPILPSRRT